MLQPTPADGGTAPHVSFSAPIGTVEVGTLTVAPGVGTMRWSQLPDDQVSVCLLVVLVTSHPRVLVGHSEGTLQVPALRYPFDRKDSTIVGKSLLHFALPSTPDSTVHTWLVHGCPDHLPRILVAPLQHPIKESPHSSWASLDVLPACIYELTTHAIVSIQHTLPRELAWGHIAPPSVWSASVGANDRWAVQRALFTGVAEELERVLRTARGPKGDPQALHGWADVIVKCIPSNVPPESRGKIP